VAILKNVFVTDNGAKQVRKSGIFRGLWGILICLSLWVGYHPYIQIFYKSVKFFQGKHTLFCPTVSEEENE
jgi:hypothetical protein